MEGIVPRMRDFVRPPRTGSTRSSVAYRGRAPRPALRDPDIYNISVGTMTGYLAGKPKIL